MAIHLSTPCVVPSVISGTLCMKHLRANQNLVIAYLQVHADGEPIHMEYGVWRPGIPHHP